ncbi:hypothetical protein AVEN_155956-1 [Araneus ventricosus]|uniref:Uncharacterized protein n=1 Tax=Araneus ventricosus TaxID=182803 RepID=A0A4Y2GWY5_ARAVE|nr:hypothetical protein AVEN_155956-1 [Araneus ventricosus]
MGSRRSEPIILSDFLPQFYQGRVCKYAAGSRSDPGFLQVISFLPYKSQTTTIPESDRLEAPNLWYAFPWGYAKDHLGVREIKLLMAETRKRKGLKKLENFVSPSECLVFNNYTT